MCWIPIRSAGPARRTPSAVEQWEALEAFLESRLRPE